ncbi:MAG: hypothetical protein WBK55_07400 [Alphaproteobacteria bacterium]
MSKNGVKYYASGKSGSIFCVLAPVADGPDQPLATLHMYRKIKGQPDQKIGKVSVRINEGRSAFPYLADFDMAPGLTEETGRVLYAAALKYLRKETEYQYVQVEVCSNDDVLRGCAILNHFAKAAEFIDAGRKVITYKYDLDVRRRGLEILQNIDATLKKRALSDVSIETPSSRL